jgi:hypothetical protein
MQSTVRGLEPPLQVSVFWDAPTGTPIHNDLSDCHKELVVKCLHQTTKEKPASQCSYVLRNLQWMELSRLGRLEMYSGTVNSVLTFNLVAMRQVHERSDFGKTSMSFLMANKLYGPLRMLILFSTSRAI